MFYNEIVASGRDGKYLSCPLLLLDPKMLIPWDFMHSSIHNMNLIVKDKPGLVKQRWDILFAGHILDCGFIEDKDYNPLMDSIHDWVNKYPELLTIYHR